MASLMWLLRYDLFPMNGTFGRKGDANMVVQSQLLESDCHKLNANSIPAELGSHKLGDFA